ncbi:MAG: hypothetical protein RLY43_1239 [Bacteroidota bacterium]
MTQDQIVLISYLSGVIAAYFLIAIINDTDADSNAPTERLSFFFTLLSWVVPFWGILIFIYVFLSTYHPTLKRRKK